MAAIFGDQTGREKGAVIVAPFIIKLIGDLCGETQMLTLVGKNAGAIGDVWAIAIFEELDPG